MTGSTGYLIGGTGPGETPLATVIARAPTCKGAEAGSGPREASVLRTTADRRPRQRQTARRQPAEAGSLALSLARPPAPPAGGSTSLTTPSSSTGAPESSPTRSKTSGSSSLDSGRASALARRPPWVSGSEPGYLHKPDDAYLLKDGTVSVADAQQLSRAADLPREEDPEGLRQPTSCSHEPPRFLGSPNGDTPLADGNILDLRGERAPTSMKSPRRQAVRLDRAPADRLPLRSPAARIRTAIWSPTTRVPAGSMNSIVPGKISGPINPSSLRTRMLNHPSLAERLPRLHRRHDDYRARVVIIDPRTRKIVWQYGHTGEPGNRTRPSPPPARLRPAWLPTAPLPTHPLHRLR